MTPFFETLCEVWPPLCQAPAITRFLGDSALFIGSAGLMTTAALAIWHALDVLRIPGRDSTPAVAPLVWGPLHHALRGIVEPGGEIRTALSADAASEFLFGRLQRFADSREALGRFLAYAPLLVGLAGTMLGLSSLLSLAGNGTLAEGASSSPAAGGSHLQGVFYGTLGGILGSLLASVGNLAFTFVADHWIRRSEDYLNARVLPRIPAQRVSLKLEETVLGLIENKLQVITQQLGRSLEPLASNLALAATQAAKAATVSSDAFSTAARAVATAGDLEAAAKALAKGIKENRATAEDIENASIALRDSATAHTKMEDALTHAATRLANASNELDSHVSRLTEGIEAHAQQVNLTVASFGVPLERLDQQIGTVSTSFQGLAIAVRERNRLEEGAVKGTLASAKTLQESLDTVRVSVSRFDQETIALRQALEQFSSTVTTALGAEFGAKVDQLVKRLEEVLTDVATPLTHGAAQMKHAGTSLEQSAAAAQAMMPEVDRSLRTLVELFQALTREVTTLAVRAAEMTAAVTRESDPSPPLLEPRDAALMLKEAVHQLNAIRASLSRPQPPSPTRLAWLRRTLRW